jgi:hypothetical protein
MKKKFVIWGYPLHTHTHSYIHHGYYNALKALGYDVVWLEDNEENSQGNFENCIFITEHQVTKFMPIVKSSIYLIHNLYAGLSPNFDGHDALGSNFKIFDNLSSNFYSFLVYHKNYEWNDEVEKISDTLWWHEKHKTFVTMWATDLLPHQIDLLEPVLYDPTKENINFVGTVHGTDIQKFVEVCENNGKKFQHFGGYGKLKNTIYDENNYTSNFYNQNSAIDTIRNSYFSFDIREKGHRDNGYNSCRLFKNLSYGMPTGTNSVKSKILFGDHIVVNENLNDLYFEIEEFYKKSSYDSIRNSMNFIRDNHTYINRIKDIIYILERV